MEILGDLFRFLALFCAGIATGAWVVTQRALIPMRRALPPEGAVHLHVVTSREMDRYQPPCAAAATASGLLILVLGLAADRTAVLWTSAGVVSMTGASLVSMLRNMPINRRMASWPSGPPPAEFAELQEKWIRANLVRTLLGLAGFASYVVAVL
jgi:uncharacterized membrane protein